MKDNFVPMTLDQMFSSKITYPVLTSKELDSGNFDIEYLIQGALVKGQPCIVGGPKKALKTTFLIAMAVSLATGMPFLGRMMVRRRCRVAVMSGESGLGTIQETARRVALAMGVQLSEIDGLLWSTALPKFGDQHHLLAINQFVEANKVECLIVDPAYLCMPGGDAGNLFVQGAMLSGISTVCQQHGTTLVIAHHTRKNRATVFEPPELEELSWAGFQEFARQWLLLGRREKYEPGTGQHKLWLSCGGSAGHSALWAVDVDEGVYDPDVPRHWSIQVCTASEAFEKEAEEKKADSFSQAKDKVLEAAFLYPDGETLTAIREAAGLSSKRAKPAIDALVNEGRLRLGTIKKSGKQYEAIFPVTRKDEEV